YHVMFKPRELLCIGHGQKNIYTCLKKIRLGNTAKKMLTELVFKANGDSEKLRKMLLAEPYHICGVHNDENYPCTDDCPYKKLTNPPKGKLDLKNAKHLEKFETLKKTFHAYSKLATKYAPQCRNDICESMQRSFTVDVDKNLDFSASY